MKMGWETKALSEVLDILRNGINCKQDKKGLGQKITRIETISQAEFDFNRVGYSNLKESDKIKYKIERGDILFSHINSVVHVGKTAFYDSTEELYHGVNLLLMRPKNYILPLYLEFYLKSLFLRGYWKTICKQSVNQASVNQQDINKVLISYPKSISKQQRIVAILEESFTSIATAKENAEKNLQNARELFESYLQSVFANPGDGWEEKKLKEIIKLEYGKPLPGSKRQYNGIYPVYGANGEKDRTNEFYYDKYSIIVGRKGSAGEINFTEEKFWPLDVTYFVTYDQKKHYLNFIYYLLTNLRLPKLAKGVKPGINRNEVYSIDVHIPLLSEQKYIVAKLDALSVETKKLEAIYQQKLNDLEELKKSILKKAFDGELLGGCS